AVSNEETNFYANGTKNIQRKIKVKGHIYGFTGRVENGHFIQEDRPTEINGTSIQAIVKKHSPGTFAGFKEVGDVKILPDGNVAFELVFRLPAAVSKAMNKIALEFMFRIPSAASNVINEMGMEVNPTKTIVGFIFDSEDGTYKNAAEFAKKDNPAKEIVRKIGHFGRDDPLDNRIVTMGKPDSRGICSIHVLNVQDGSEESVLLLGDSEHNLAIKSNKSYVGIDSNGKKWTLLQGDTGSFDGWLTASARTVVVNADTGKVLNRDLYLTLENGDILHASPKGMAIVMRGSRGFLGATGGFLQETVFDPVSGRKGEMTSLKYLMMDNLGFSEAAADALDASNPSLYGITTTALITLSALKALGLGLKGAKIAGKAGTVANVLSNALIKVPVSEAILTQAMIRSGIDSTIYAATTDDFQFGDLLATMKGGAQSGAAFVAGLQVLGLAASPLLGAGSKIFSKIPTAGRYMIGGVTVNVGRGVIQNALDPNGSTLKKYFTSGNVVRDVGVGLLLGYGAGRLKGLLIANGSKLALSKGVVGMTAYNGLSFGTISMAGSLVESIQRDDIGIGNVATRAILSFGGGYLGGMAIGASPVWAKRILGGVKPDPPPKPPESKFLQNHRMLNRLSKKDGNIGAGIKSFAKSADAHPIRTILGEYTLTGVGGGTVGLGVAYIDPKNRDENNKLKNRWRYFAGGAVYAMGAKGGTEIFKNLRAGKTPFLGKARSGKTFFGLG
ncbi:MAG: hypothetical protein KAR31_10860, partial [Candidatus Omnitrophica bacterium]|nr:hypothetical protein [Candidatus Omnitrophota bacterium]